MQRGVEEILVDEGVRGVRLADGRTLRSDLVVSNADAAWTYRHLIKVEQAVDRPQNRPLHFSNGLFVGTGTGTPMYPTIL